MDYTITPVLLILDKRMKHIELNTGAVGVGNTAETSEITALENKRERHLREFVDRIDGMDVFSGGISFTLHMEYVDF